MKKLLAIIGVVTLFATATQAQNTNLEQVAKSAFADAKDWAQNSGTNGVSIRNTTNYFSDIYLTLPQKLDGIGGGLLFGYNINDNFSAFIALDYLSEAGTSELYMPSGNLSVHGTIHPLTGIGISQPFVIGGLAGIGTPLAGSSTGNPAQIIGTYVKTEIGSSKVKGETVNFHIGAGLDKWFNTGTRDGNFIQLFIGGTF